MIAVQHDTPLGVLTLCATETDLCGLYFENHKGGGAPAHARSGAAAVIDAARCQLDEYFAHRRQAFELPLAPDGTTFQKSVWRALACIPYGRTTSYAAIATQIGAPRAVRAAGAAIGRNPLSIIVPCHRVLGRNGALTGFAGGLEAKRFLLSLETAC